MSDPSSKPWFLNKNYDFYWKNYILSMNYIGETNVTSSSSSVIFDNLSPSYENYIKISRDVWDRVLLY